MPFSFKLATALIVLAFPLVELALLIKAGQAIGFWGVLGVILGTGAAGVFVVRTAGLTAVQRLFAEFESGGSPIRSLLDQGLRLTAGVLLVLPGLIGDGIGILLLVPLVRHWLTRSAAALWRVDTMMDEVGGDRRFADHAASTSGHGPMPSRYEGTSSVTIIEGEYERLDDDPPAARRPNNHA